MATIAYSDKYIFEHSWTSYLILSKPNIHKSTVAIILGSIIFYRYFIITSRLKIMLVIVYILVSTILLVK